MDSLKNIKEALNILQYLKHTEEIKKVIELLNEEIAIHRRNDWNLGSEN